MTLDFTGQVAVVTGAGGNLGSTFCRNLAARGAAIVANDLGGDATGTGSSTSYADAVVAAVTAAGGKAVADYNSVATAEGGEAIVETALRAFGRVDVVISNAGNQRNGFFGELSEAEVDAVLAVHLKGAFNICQPAYRAMKKQGYGRLVLVSSQSGIFGNPVRANYGAAKTGLIGLMNVIAQETPPGIAVNCLFPNADGGRLGGTPLAERPDREWLVAASERSNAYADGLTAEFVSAMAIYLASRACDTSQNMYSVLGGQYARIFVGLTQGWFVPGTTAPTAEDIVDHLQAIDDRSDYHVPLSGMDEMDIVINARKLAGLD